MPQPKSKSSEFWGEFAAALQKKEERRPEGRGWLTFDEVRKAYPNIGAGRIREMLASPSVERFKGFTVKNGRLSGQVWYRSK